MLRLLPTALVFCGFFVMLGCRGDGEQTRSDRGQPQVEHPDEPPPVVDPVPLWKAGKSDTKVDASRSEADGYLVLDLGDHWTPYILSEGEDPNGALATNDYRPTYLALAAGEFPKDHHGYRAKRDKYLELFGIPPTLTLLRERFSAITESECAKSLDLEPLKRFDRFLSYERNRRSQRQLNKYKKDSPRIAQIVARHEAEDLWSLDLDKLSGTERKFVEEFKPIALNVEAIKATQKRLECEGYYKDKKEPYILGVFDWVTHEALAEFEKRHRVFGWAFIGRDTIHILRETPVALEHEAVVRVLTERAMHAVKALEDGSVNLINGGKAPTYVNSRGELVEVPNIETALRERLIEAFGLQTPESTLEWLKSLGEIGEEQRVALREVPLPEYYSDNMPLYVEIDRGDVWYDFPWDEEGNRERQRVKSRPRLTVFVQYRQQKIPIAYYGTTIGGWRSEFVEGATMWKYKDSPVGKRVWKHIASAPVWIPPESTPPKSLLLPARRNTYVFNKHEMGPSYASAYGLVAAYHRRFRYDENGQLTLGGDQGIRTHGSVDYMSIMRRYSHGCHRLHNHLAVRLMSFVLNHKPHQRRGHQVMDYKREIEYEQEIYELEFTRGGYFFDLEQPVWVEVVEGQIQGELQEPIATLLPKFDEELGAYIMPDGSWASVNRRGELLPREMPAEFQPKLTSIFDLPPEAAFPTDAIPAPENAPPPPNTPAPNVAPPPTAPVAPTPPPAPAPSVNNAASGAKPSEAPAPAAMIPP